MDPNEICIGGNKYKIVDCVSGTTVITPTSSNTDLLQSINEYLRRLVEFTIPKDPSYRYFQLTIGANEMKHEISLGIRARHLYINTTHTIKIYLWHEGSADAIELTSADAPLTINDLNRKELIEKFYVTTDTNGTVLTVFALGEVM